MSSELAGQVAAQVPPPPTDPEGIWARVRSAFVWLVTFPSRLSTAGKAGFVIFLVLLLLIGLSLTLFWLDENNGPWQHLISWQWGATVAALAIAIPLVAYRGLRLWLEGDASLFPEVDYAWNAGLDALKQHGIDLGATPVYLILGSSNEEQEAAIINAAGRRLRVNGVPEGPAPLHWYANPEAIYLFATEASWLSGLATLKERHKVPDRPGAYVAELDLSPTAAPEEATPVASDAPVDSPGNDLLGAPEAATPRGTIMLDQFVAKEAVAQQSQAPMADKPQSLAPSPTQTTGRLTMFGDFISNVGDQGPAVLPAHEASERSQQLEYVCQLLSHARTPVCPLNGVVAMLPFEMVKGPPAEIEQLQLAVRSDLNVLQRGLQLRCPVTCLVSGLEHERGFRELVRRVGRDMASAQRFGQKFDICQPTTSDQMTALSAHVCGAFEDWVYTLFREEDSLTRAGNTRLYGLLCKVRCMLKTRLMQVLSGGFGYDPERTNGKPLAFSGCYFAATGATKDRQAFVRGIFDKLHEEQEFVEWLPGSLNESRWHRRLARLGIAVNVALVVFVISMIAVKFF